MPEATAAVTAIQAGDLESLERILNRNPDVVNTRSDGQRTLLHFATDWPGHRLNTAAVIALLAQHGANPNLPFVGKHSETPLHWAASNDDVPAVEALLGCGADIEAPGSVIDGGPPISDAVAFGCWNAARRLAEHGAHTNLWQSAALGLMDRLEASFAADPKPAPQEITNALWCAAHGGQQTAAEYLLARGGDPKWVGYDGLTAAGAAQRSGAEQLAEWLRSKTRVLPRG